MFSIKTTNIWFVMLGTPILQFSTPCLWLERALRRLHYSHITLDISKYVSELFAYFHMYINS